MEVLDATRVLRADHRGNSWPVIVTTDAGMRFTKLRGAAQGTGALVAEVIVAELAEALGLRVPARSLVRLPAGVDSLDGNDELAQLLRASVGINLGFAHLENERMIGPADIGTIDVEQAAAIIWLDGLVLNPDRTAANPNLLWSGAELYLIDHGASLGFQYAWADVDEEAPRRPLAAREPHLLRPRVPDLAPFDEGLAARLTRDVLERAVNEVPDEFLLPLIAEHRPRNVPDALRRRRAAYAAFLWKRLKAPRPFLEPVLAASPRRGRPAWLSRQS